MTGELTAKQAIISGHFKGQCEAQQVEITQHGTLEGEVISDELVIDKGGHFSGHSRETKQPQLRAVESVDVSGEQSNSNETACNR